MTRLADAVLVAVTAAACLVAVAALAFLGWVLVACSWGLYNAVTS